MRGRRAPAVWVSGALLLASLVGCGTDDGEAAAPRSQATTTEPTPATGRVVGPSTSTAPAGSADAALAVLPTVAAVLRDPAGRARDLCLLHANTPDLRLRGLMGVADPALGGCDGMLFSFTEDTVAGFWMRDTLLPLAITFFGADGTVVGQDEMVPCPDDGDCPSHAPDRPYRYALEVPTASELRIGRDAVLQVGTGPCERSG